MGNTYVQKKPFYKRVWFWIVVVILVLIIGGSIGGSKPHTTGSNTADSSKSKKTEFKLTDTVDLDGVTFKVNNVSFSDGDEISKPDQGKKYVKVNVTITNNGDDKFSYNPFDFKLNDKGNQTDLDEFISDSNNQLKSGDLAKGGSVTGTMTGQATEGDKLQLMYNGSI